MHWILQESLFKEHEWADLVGTLERFGLPYSAHQVVPFVGELVPPASIASGKVVCFGSSRSTRSTPPASTQRMSRGW